MTSNVRISRAAALQSREDPAAVHALVAAGTLAVPSYVTFGRAVDLSPGREANAEGGRPLSGGVCTSGYVVFNTSTRTRYLLTAGHCGHTGTAMTYNGVTLPVVGRKYDPGTSYDYQWHTAPGFTLTNLIDEGLAAPRRITAVWPRANMVEGDFICKWGSATGYTCGTIVTKQYDLLGHPGFVLVRDPNGTDLSRGGDSGGPWYYDYYNEAWGIHTDNGRENPNDAVFMPIEYISASGLAVLTTQ